jgi:hypothetical protein
VTRSLPVELVSSRRLHFDDGSPVRAASALAPFGDGLLVAQDDAVHAAWWTGGSVRPVTVLPPVQGRTVFGPSTGSKHLKPDLEAACAVGTTDGPAALLLGSGSLLARTTCVLVRPGADGPVTAHVELSGLYARVAAALGIAVDELNLEGACLVGDRLRWFQRGSSALGVPSASVDVDLDALLAAVSAGAGEDDIALGEVHRYELGSVDGVALAVTDAVALPDGRLLVSAAAEDAPNAVDDGPVVGSALLVLHGTDVVARADLPLVDGAPPKVEGLAATARGGGVLDVVAVVDEDVEGAASTALGLRVG